MEKCLQCSKQLKHVPGRKQKSFCDVNCRNKYFYAQRKKQITDAKAFLVPLPPDYFEVNKAATLAKEVAPDELDRLSNLIKESPDAASVLEHARIGDRIRAIKSEKIPESRDTVLGRKAWAIEQQKRITELEKQIK